MDSVKPAVAETPAATEVPSFLKALFQGEIQEELVFPFPEIPPDVKETVAAFSEAYQDFDAAHIDSDKIDATTSSRARPSRRWESWASSA